MSGPIRDLAGDFETFTPAEWQALAQRAIGDRDFQRTLIRQTQGGLARGPVFFETKAPRPLTALPAAVDPYRPWGIAQGFSDADPETANSAILEDLAGGVSDLVLKIDPSGKHGIAVKSVSDAARLLDGVDIVLAPVFLDAGTTPDIAEHILPLLEAARKTSGELRGGLGLTPTDADGYALAARLGDALPGIETHLVDARAIHDAGGTEVQELAFAAAGLNRAMRGLMESGLSADLAAQRIGVTLAVDADIHGGIAKIRAARRIFAAILEQFGVSSEHRRPRIRAVTSFRTLSASDPWTNLIRTATAGFAAGCASVDALTVRPLTDAIGRPSAFGRRLARNLHIMLQEESGIGRVADPAGGSFLHETLTESLAKAAWEQFRILEGDGGYDAAVSGGPFAGEIAAAHAALIERHATGRDTLVGVSQFVPADVKPILAADTDWQANLPPSPFAPVRIAEPFEARHARSSTAAKDKRTVFLATLGTLADFNARATFAAGRLAVAGLAVSEAAPYETRDALIATFKKSGSPLAVLCGTDAAYGEAANETAAALKEAGATAVWLAGAPDPDFTEVDHFIHMKSHSLDDADAAHAVLEIA
ncbi:methylmalonyl-CoA mutase family protein [Hyphobacterium marinum]|uniref:Methylmalonyl-CoA mutase family protein n=1 Tax=Hyphobacterium marinum TaxID=3116574 RepID=A0ABU7M079_9PROT|nr:methylmalonyl-CoA mutase family protein [Hyphobacterium sp. Y6023]MEE2567106.1 methylmalonyl-CoA mutase family protein [Hyphobacterium sp. Y6023]